MTMFKYRDRTWVALIVLGIGLLIAAGLGLFGYIAFTSTPLHPDAQQVPSVTRSAFVPKWGGAVEQARQIVRASVTDQNLPGSVGGGRGRRRDRVGRGVRLGGPREARARRARDAVQDRHRVHGAHVGRRGPAAGEGPSEARRRDSGVRAGLPEEAVAGHAAAADGACRRRHERRRRRRSAVRGALQPAGRWTAVLRAGVAAVRAGDRVPLFALRLDCGERGGRSRRERAVPPVHARADLRAAGHERHESRRRDGAGPGAGERILPEVRGESPLRPGPDAGARLLVLRGVQRVRVHPVRPGPLRDGHRQRQAAAARPRSNCSRRRSGCDRDRRRATGLAGTSRPSRCRGSRRAWSATTGTRWAGRWRR